jgi:hypothetical protein
MQPTAETEKASTEVPPPLPGAKADEVRTLMPALAALVILVTLGLGLIFFAWWGARYARRRMGKPLGPSHPMTDAWYSKPLAEPPPPESDQESEMGS